MRPTLWAVGIVVLALAATPAFADHDMDPQKHLDNMTQELNLSAEQRGQVEQIMNDYRARIQALKDQIDALKKEKQEKFNAVLNAEQQEKYQKMKENREKQEKRGWFGKEKH